MSAYGAPPDSTIERALSISGAEFTPEITAATQAFSNVNIGEYASDYCYEGVPANPRRANGKSFAYLAGRGWRTVKIPIRWERIQQKLNGPLDATELGPLTAAIDSAHGAELQVILDLHNYGLYYLDGSQATPRGEPNVGYRKAVGIDADLPIAAFADLWSRLATAVGSHPAVIGFHIMNEPQSEGGLTRSVYYQASQAAVSAIRAVNKSLTIRVGGWRWSDCFEWADSNTAPWIDDPAGKTWYEAHHYWSEANDGDYTTYDNAVADALARGYTAGSYPDPLYTRILDELHGFTKWCADHKVTGVIGENSWPHDSDIEKWNRLAEVYYAECDRLRLAVDTWSAGELYSKNGDPLNIYYASSGLRSGLDRPFGQAAVVEAHLPR